ncbi:pentapeptide repeat-containing protein [Flavobacterium sp. MFBS3-15]|uniref:pentapeptide repeat-containing protein n=1 Tax=Flavobacterium sp. MFBS3-15 TaxID=2989816 RepID=UPI00223655BF|nr:pentapeptide repeat-containing protein [Flavobacterium sp. MFBS3-15]MCW4469852.1 pentapeptide repeat-containing protein [Flavobacterium sp. MFBS3-15]
MENYIIDQQITGKIYNQDDIMYKDFERCTFTQCDFTACNFTGVAFIDCNFISCNFSEAKINYVGLRGAFFDNCNFTGVNFSMVDKLFFSIEFKNSTLDYAKFYTLKIKGTIFTDCSLIAVDFMSTDLTEVLFDNCNLHKAVFHDSIAQKADFTTSYNYSIDPERNKLRRARFSQEGLKGLLEKYEIVVVE